jgi:hypothetical protein
MPLTRHKLVWSMVATVLSAVLATATFSSSAAPAATEAELKAVLLFHLTQFISWPTAASNQNEFVIGIIGPDPFGPVLDAVVKGEKVGGRPIRVIRESRVRTLEGCSLVYVSAQAREPVSRIASALQNSPVLLVGEAPDFLDDGGMVRLRRTSEQKIRIQIHLRRLREEGLNASAQLLRVSDVVQGGDK